MGASMLCEPSTSRADRFAASSVTEHDIGDEQRYRNEHISRKPFAHGTRAYAVHGERVRVAREAVGGRRRRRRLAPPLVIPATVCHCVRASFSSSDESRTVEAWTHPKPTSPSALREFNSYS
ncbi:hypothetical protein EVAR_94337_1 [Eumeta japonica]|uniref:Uncharacterized protein n=1 Tax=Eumeta variegata TaxID=151549 RepID=A0A4C1TPU5_EUMVA|nr:hypothetical protein EVAR_94337_1 [Eumeta japonica]